MEEIKIVHTVTNPLNKRVFLENVESLLSEKIFNDLIDAQNPAIEITISFKTIAKED